jgi:hypothetical protein
MKEWEYNFTPKLRLDENKWSASCLNCFTPHTHWIGGWVVPRNSLDTPEKKKEISSPCWKLNKISQQSCTQHSQFLSTTNTEACTQLRINLKQVKNPRSINRWVLLEHLVMSSWTISLTPVQQVWSQTHWKIVQNKVCCTQTKPTIINVCTCTSKHKYLYVKTVQACNWSNLYYINWSLNVRQQQKPYVKSQKFQAQYKIIT